MHGHGVEFLVVNKPRKIKIIRNLGTIAPGLARVHLKTRMSIKALEQQVVINMILVPMMFLGAQLPGANFGASIVCRTSSSTSHENLMNCGPSTITSSTSGTCERQ